MTVIIGTIWPDGHLVSSDGREMIGEFINSDAFNKTFSLYGGLVRGAYSNSINFNLSSYERCKSICEHITEISPIRISENLHHLVELIVKGLVFRLSVAQLVPSFPMNKRNVSLIITGREFFSHGDYFLYCLRLYYNEVKKMICHSDITPEFHADNCCRHYVIAPTNPDMQAKILENLCQNIPGYNIVTIGNAHYNAIQHGLKETAKLFAGRVCPVGGAFYSQPQYHPQKYFQ